MPGLFRAIPFLLIGFVFFLACANNSIFLYSQVVLQTFYLLCTYPIVAWDLEGDSFSDRETKSECHPSPGFHRRNVMVSTMKVGGFPKFQYLPSKDQRETILFVICCQH